MSKRNKYGLSRHISEDVKLVIRRNSKFACVVPNCRNAFYTYEHLIPEFKDAREHDPSNICLACPNHNPRKKGPNGRANFSKQQLIAYYDKIRTSDLAPEIRNSDFFYGFDKPVEIQIGKSTFIDIHNIINVNGQNVLSFEYKREAQPFEPEITFTGIFNKHNGERLFEINDNEWVSNTDHWDVETGNGKIIIKDEHEILFEAHKLPEHNRIEITKLNLWYNPFHIVIMDGKLFVGRVSEDNNKYLYVSIDGYFHHNKCAIYLTSMDLNADFKDYGWELSGNLGMSIFQNGIYLGKGGGTMWIQSINILKSPTLEDMSLEFIPAKSKIPEKANYFVKGKVEEKQIQFPQWTEVEFWLNGQKLDSRPNSWGLINDQGEELYYLSRQEKSDLTLNPGFVGFFADDLLNTPLQDRVFEVEIEDTSDNGITFVRRVKRYMAAGFKVISEFNSKTNRFYHPHEFMGESPWCDMFNSPTE